MAQPDGTRLKVPHMGWNRVKQVAHDGPGGRTKHPLWRGIEDNAWFYFVHSFYIQPADAKATVGETIYGAPFTSAIARDNIFATQFHPEKSAAAGLALYKNFVTWNP